MKAAEEKIEELLLMIEDQKKISQAKSKMLERESQRNTTLKKENEELRMQQDLMMKETIEDAKKSAAMAILQAKIQLMKPVIDGDFDLEQIEKDCNEWHKILAGLSGESSSHVAEQVNEASDDPAVEGEKEVVPGDEGINDQA